ncbi:MAG: hypothetical protein V3T08_10210 [Gemmatimonadota bacterium]
MGIFDAIGDFFGSDVGKSLGQIGVDILRQQVLPQGPVAQPFPFPFPTPSVPQFPTLPAGRVPISFPTFDTGGGPPTMATPSIFRQASVMAPQPEPFAFDQPCPSFFKSGGMTARPTRFITAVNPATGQLTWWEHAGRPVLMSRDLAVVKRVRRIAAKAGTVTRRRVRRKR